MTTPSPYKTVDDLVDDVIIGSRLPTSQVTLTADNIISFLDEEMKTEITELVHTVREDFWLYNFDTQIVATTYNYTMPQRAVAGGLRDVVFVDSSGNEIEVARLDPDQLKTPAFYGYRPAFTGQGVFIQNDQVVLWPQTSNNSAYILRQKYERRPNTLTAEANCAQITGINIAAGTVDVASYPTADWTTATTFDIISNKPQFVSQGDDLAITLISGTGPYTFTFSALPTTVAVGMWICPAGLTCIPQIPFEAYPLLSNMGIRRVHMAMQNSNGFQVAAKIVEDNKESVRKMLTPRVQGSPRKLVNRSSRLGLMGYPYFR